MTIQFFDILELNEDEFRQLKREGNDDGQNNESGIYFSSVSVSTMQVKTEKERERAVCRVSKLRVVAQRCVQTVEGARTRGIDDCRWTMPSSRINYSNILSGEFFTLRDVHYERLAVALKMSEIRRVSPQ